MSDNTSRRLDPKDSFPTDSEVAPGSFVPPISRRSTPRFAGRREALGAAFERGAQDYHEVRPGYPQACLKRLPQARMALDIGAGTGKLSEQLRAETICALDPSADMLRTLRQHQPGVLAVQAKAEATGFAPDTFDLVTSAQTWHWVDPAVASAEAARISTPDATLFLVWNTLDVTQPWVHRLSRIMHSADNLKEGFLPAVHAPWELSWRECVRWEQWLNPQEIHALAHTRSYWLRANEKSRARLTENLNWYLYEHLGLDEETEVPLPYRCDAFAYTKA